MDFRNLYARASPGWPRARCPSRSPTPPRTPGGSRSRCGPATRTVSPSRSSPSSGLSGYAIDDLLLQDVILDAVVAAVVTSAEATAGLTPLIVVGAPLRHGNRLYNCAVVLHRGEVLGGRARSATYPPTASSTRSGTSPPAPAARTGATACSAPTPTARCRSARTCCSTPTTCRARRPRRGLRGPVGAGTAEPEAALAGATVLAQHLRLADHRRPRPTNATCSPAPRPPAASPPTSTPRRAGGVVAPTCRGTGRRWSTRAATCSPRPSASPPGPARPSPTSISTGCGRSGCARAPSTTTRVALAADGGGFRIGRRSGCDPPAGDLGLRRAVDRFPFVPDARPVSPRTATRPTTSRSPGSSSGCGPSAAIGGCRRSSSASPAGSTPPTPCSSRPRRWTGSDGRAPTSSPSRCRASRRASGTKDQRHPS